jgi:hypothetical protein
VSQASRLCCGVVSRCSPWRPWANREVLDAVEGAHGDSALDEIIVLACVSSIP